MLEAHVLLMFFFTNVLPLILLLTHPNSQIHTTGVHCKSHSEWRLIPNRLLQKFSPSLDRMYFNPPQDQEYCRGMTTIILPDVVYYHSVAYYSYLH